MHRNQRILPQITSKWDTYAASYFFSCVENPHNNFISLTFSKSKAAQMAQWVQMQATCSNDLSPITSPLCWNGRNGSTNCSMASTYMNWLHFLVHGLTKVCDPSSKGYNAFLWSPRALHTRGARHACRQAHLYT